jgi:hypothetical protein
MHYADIYQEIRRGTAAETVPRWAVSLLREIADGRRDLTGVWHPLGFLCLPIERLGDHGVCVHQWTLALPPCLTTSAVHSHSWDLSSYVLYGKLRNERMRVVDSPDFPTHRVFDVRSHGDVDELSATTRLVSYHLESVNQYGEGGVYYLPAGEFHATVLADEKGAATVALGHSRKHTADLTLGGVYTRSHVVRRRRCAAPETARAARLIADRLEASHTA